MNASDIKSGRSSRCIALDVAHVNRQMYVLAVPPVVFVNNGQAKSTPTDIDDSLFQVGPLFGGPCKVIL